MHEILVQIELPPYILCVAMLFITAKLVECCLNCNPLISRVERRREGVGWLMAHFLAPRAIVRAVF